MTLGEEDFVEDIDDLDDDELDHDDEFDQASFVCEDCDYRWEDATQEDIDADTHVCPMCGSTNVTQL